MYDVVKDFVLPPGNVWLVLVLAFGFFCIRARKLGLALMAAGLIVFYLLSTPFVGRTLSRLAQSIPPLSDSVVPQSGAGAIVVVSGGFSAFAPEYGGATVDEVTLVRLRYAARLHRLTGLPVLVSGGPPRGGPSTLAHMMATSLEQDFGIIAKWHEDRSRDTYENAIYSAEILKRDGIDRILLVTHASHMPRAARVFAQTGLQVIPAPTAFSAPPNRMATNYIPRLSGLQESHYALYEWIGQLWYALRH